jgi:hypothetical protein
VTALHQWRDDGPFRYIFGTDRKGYFNSMNPQVQAWCGEGDLFSRPSLIVRKLYTQRMPKNGRSSRKTI